MLVLLGGGVVLLLALLGTTTKAEHQVEGRLLLDVVVGQSPAIFQLLASENQTLLIRRNAYKQTRKSLTIRSCNQDFNHFNQELSVK